MDRAQLGQDHGIGHEEHDVTFIGWRVYPPNMGNPLRTTITAGPGGTKLVNEPANQL